MQETQETWVHSLGWEDPLEKGKATHYNILALRIPWTEALGGYILLLLSHFSCVRLCATA